MFAMNFHHYQWQAYEIPNFVRFQIPRNRFSSSEPVPPLHDIVLVAFKEGDSSKPEAMMESNVDAAEWKLEVERVLPQLKVTIRTDNKVI